MRVSALAGTNLEALRGMIAEHLHEARGGSSHGGLFHAVDWLPTLVKLAGGSTATSLPLDGYDVLPALMKGGAASPRDEVPVNIAACGPDAHGTRSIIDGPQAAIVVGELKLVVDCFWRSQRDLTRAQLFNLTADAAVDDHGAAGATRSGATSLRRLTVSVRGRRRRPGRGV